MNRPPIIDDLYQSLGSLYAARYKSCGKLVDNQYPEMDLETFNEIVHLQTEITRLISRLEKKHENI